MKRLLVTAVALLSVFGCSEREAEYQTAVDTLTRRQKDSLISTMPVPGAGAVGRAMDAVGRANARTLTHDTIG